MTVEAAESGAGVQPTLLLVDIQQAFEDPAWGPRNNPEAEANATRLLQGWRQAGAPVIHVRHKSRSPQGLFKGAALEFKPDVQPIGDEPVVDKSVNSAFIGTDLEKRLRDASARTLVIAGLTTDHCCSTTARMAANLGFEVWFVSDATATFDRTAPDGGLIDADTMHRTALTSLSGEFAEIVDAQTAVRRLSSPARIPDPSERPAGVDPVRWTP